MSQTLYRKYRPQTWSDIAGQDHVKVTLAQQIAGSQTAHAYLLAGPRGVGKTTMARIFAKAINCEDRGADSGEPCGKCTGCLAVTEGGSLDIIEIDAASHTGVDSVRENIVENSRFAPSRLKNKVFIIDEVHMLSTSAFNALLKTLEEPPANVVFLLATTELHKIPATVVSRCQRFDLRKIAVADVVARLARIAESEKVKVGESVLSELARLSEGCLRDAEGLLGKLLAVAESGRVSDEDALAVLPRSDWEAAARLVDALVAGDVSAGLTVIGECLDAGADVEQFAGEVTELLRKAMLVKLAGGRGDAFASELDEARLERVVGWATAAELPFLVRALEIMLEKRRELKGSHPVQLPLELAVVLITENIKNIIPPPPATEGSRGRAGVGVSKEDMPPPPARGRAGVGVKEEPTPQKNVAAELASAQPKKSKPTESNPPCHPESSEAHDLSSRAKRSEDPGPSIEELKPQEKETVGQKSVPPKKPKPTTTTLPQLKKLWPQFITKASEANHSMHMLLGAVEPVEIEGQTVRLGSGFPYYKDKLNEDKTKMILEGALAAVLGEKLLVEGVTIEKNSEMVHNNDAEKLIPQPEVAAVAPEQVDSATKIAAAFGGEVI